MLNLTDRFDSVQLIAFGLWTAGVITALIVTVRLFVESRRTARERRHERRRISDDLVRVADQLRQFDIRLAELEHQSLALSHRRMPEQEPQVSPVAEKALYLQRLGQAPEEIAAQLGMSSGEVKLLLKVQSMREQPTEKADLAASRYYKSYKNASGWR
ncbi:MAG: hypothetical protein JNL98_09820 [Bryobacterales bacterium]|nr:hypothetical protein [Bryobacterales bacterium]